jgi:hypothetical protein
VWRVLRKRFHLKACKLSIVEHVEHEHAPDEEQLIRLVCNPNAAAVGVRGKEGSVAADIGMRTGKSRRPHNGGSPVAQTLSPAEPHIMSVSSFY